jgi:hypothetical protein
MKNRITPIKNAYDSVIDFIVEHECEGCKRRRKKLKKFASAVTRVARDKLRTPPK